eukprot:TRINITY_DN10934_c0_g3_i1.p1 TRINITY_DN10934_c0_g3~~TRINITY_DN10934_c0_g3_i1.p1  ORF type:complete len:674 (+),score=117.03 TRINITY_DN10934_c0_g3_i1:77-2098(+)
MFRCSLTIILLCIAICSGDLHTRAEQLRGMDKLQESAELHRQFVATARDDAKEKDRVLLSLRVISDAAVMRGDMAEAVRARRAVAMREDTATNWLHLGEAIMAWRHPDQLRTALAAYKHAAELGSPQGDVGTCRVLLDMQQPAQAAPICQRAIPLLPKSEAVDAQRMLGDGLRESGQYNEAIRAYAAAFANEKGVSCAGGLVLTLTWTARFDMVTKTLATIQKRLPVDSYNHVAETISPWVTLLLGFHPRESLISAGRHVRTVLSNIASFPPLPARKPLQTRPLHIGYISADFVGFSPVGQDLKSALSLHSEAVRVTCYSLAADDGSALNSAMKAACPRYVDLSAMFATDAAKLIRDDGVAILIDLTGYTQGERSDILAQQPAPVQIEWKGYMGSMASPYINYAVSDIITSPPNSSLHFMEKLIYVPHTLFTCDLKQDQQQVIHNPLPRSARSLYRLPEDKFIFACFNRLFKLDGDTWQVWMQILRDVPNSVLWLLRFPPEAAFALRKSATAAGIADDRIIITELFSAADHLRIKALADVFLDTPRFNAHGTAAEALWAGVPVLTKIGLTMAQRLGASIVRAALSVEHQWVADELIVQSLQEYHTQAVKLARDVSLHGRIKRALQESRMSAPLFHTKGWVKSFEVAMTMTTDLEESGKAPQHVKVGRSHEMLE